MSTRPSVEFTSSNTPVTEEQVRAIETRLGVQFPVDYRTFLMTINGGAPSRTRLRVLNTDYDVLFDWVYSVKEDRQSGDLEYQQEEIQFRMDDIPTGLIDIAHDPGGNPFFLDTTGESGGGVLFFDGRGFFDPPQKRRLLYQVATSFTELLESLEEA